MGKYKVGACRCYPVSAIVAIFTMRKCLTKVLPSCSVSQKGVGGGWQRTYSRGINRNKGVPGIYSPPAPYCDIIPEVY